MALPAEDRVIASDALDPITQLVRARVPRVARPYPCIVLFRYMTLPPPHYT